MKLQPARPSLDDVSKPLRHARVPFPREPEVDREAVGASDHHLDVGRAGGAGGGVGAGGRACATPEHGCEPGGNGLKH